MANDSTGSHRRLLGCILLAVLVVGAGAAMLLLLVTLAGRQRLAVPEFGSSVAVVEVFGVIGDDDHVLEQLDAVEDDGSVRAIVLDVDSPGGGVGATQRIVSRLRDMQAAKGTPVIAALESVAASGGYYIACAADSILTLPGTLTGSIGVILSFPEASALLTKLGIRYQVVKTGDFKDAGGFHRPLSSEERSWFESLLQEVLDQFVAAIAAGRPGLSTAEIRELADGRVFTGSEAVRLGLADRSGSLEDAVRCAARLAGIEGEPRVVRKLPRASLWERLLEERLPGLERTLLQAAPAAWPRLEYRWR